MSVFFQNDKNLCFCVNMNAAMFYNFQLTTCIFFCLSKKKDDFLINCLILRITLYLIWEEIHDIQGYFYCVIFFICFKEFENFLSQYNALKKKGIDFGA